MINIDRYERDLQKAQKRLDELLRQREQLDKEIAQLRVTIGGLSQLVGKVASQEDLRISKQDSQLTEMCREYFRAIDEPITPADVLEGIAYLGFRKFNYSNPASLVASVHTTLKRMAENGEIVETTKKGKKAYKRK